MPRRVPTAARVRSAVLLAALCLGVGGCPIDTTYWPDVIYEPGLEDPTVSLPRDEAPHSYGGFEWWYYTGRLQAADGRGFGVEFAVFHVPQEPVPKFVEGWIAHYAVFNEQTKEFVYSQRGVWRPADLAAVVDGGIELETDLIEIHGGDGFDRLSAALANGRYALSLVAADPAEPVLHGENGYVPFGADGRSYYYSRPRMLTYGSLVVDGVAVDVVGSLWFDRQWGNDLVNPWQPWRWFSVRLDDGTDLMLFTFDDAPDASARGTLIEPDGAVRHLTSEDFAIEPTVTWTSSRTGIEYETAWRVEIPSAELTLLIESLADDFEIDARPTTLNVYWEGLCVVSGSRGETPAGGHAYVELANQ